MVAVIRRKLKRGGDALNVIARFRFVSGQAVA